jgi:hypothetical protein
LKRPDIKGYAQAALMSMISLTPFPPDNTIHREFPFWISPTPRSVHLTGTACDCNAGYGRCVSALTARGTSFGSPEAAAGRNQPSVDRCLRPFLPLSLPAVAESNVVQAKSSPCVKLSLPFSTSPFRFNSGKLRPPFTHLTPRLRNWNILLEVLINFRLPSPRCPASEIQEHNRGPWHP